MRILASICPELTTSTADATVTEAKGRFCLDKTQAAATVIEDAVREREHQSLSPGRTARLSFAKPRPHWVTTISAEIAAALELGVPLRLAASTLGLAAALTDRAVAVITGVRSPRVSDRST